MLTVTANTPRLGTARVKREMPEMLKGSVIVDADQVKIAEGADAVMAPERVPADIRVQSYAGTGVEATCASSGGSVEAWTGSFSDWRRILPNVWAVG